MLGRAGVLAGLCAAIVVAQPAKTTGVFSGTVVDSTTRQPIVKASIHLKAKPSYSATTDADGTFRFEAVKPGEYQLEITHRGYTPARAVALKPGQTNSIVRIQAGQEIGGAMAALDPEAVVTGHVTNSAGDPMPGASVWRIVEFWQNGARLYELAGSAETGDHGEFRMTAPAGDCFLAAHREASPRTFSTEPGGPEKHVAMVFYPNAPGVASAELISLKPGQQLGGMDFKLPDAVVYHIRGRIQGVGAVRDLYLGKRSLDRIQGHPIGTLVDKDGTFDLPGVEPGSYWIEVEPIQTNLTGRSAVDVTDHDVSGLKLAAAPGPRIEGAARFDGEPSVGISKLSLQFDMLDYFQFHSGGVMPIAADGAFSSKSGVMPGHYALTLERGYNAYIKSVLIDGREASAGNLDYSRGSPGKLEIILGSAAGQVSGTVHWPELLPGDPPPLPGAPLYAVLLPTETGTGNISGRVEDIDDFGFEFDYVPPGKYAVFVTTFKDDGLWQNRDFVRAISGSGTPVDMSKPDRVKVQVPPIADSEIRRAIAQVPR